MNDKQKNRVAEIQAMVDKFGYGLGQADYDVQFLLRLVGELEMSLALASSDMKELRAAYDKMKTPGTPVVYTIPVDLK